MAKFGRNPDEFSLHSMRIGGEITLAAGTHRSESLKKEGGGRPIHTRRIRVIK